MPNIASFWHVIIIGTALSLLFSIRLLTWWIQPRLQNKMEKECILKIKQEIEHINPKIEGAHFQLRIEPNEHHLKDTIEHQCQYFTKPFALFDQFVSADPFFFFSFFFFFSSSF